MDSMSPEEVERMRAQMAAGMNANYQQSQYQQNIQAAQNGQSIPQAQPAQPMYNQMPGQQPAQPKMTAQQAMQARMAASKSQANAGMNVSQSVMQQGDQYQPNQMGQQTPVSNQTIINTTQQRTKNQNNIANNTVGQFAEQQQQEEQTSNGDGKSRGFKMNPIMAVVIVIVILLAVFFGYSFLSSKSGEESDVPSEDMVSEDPFASGELEWITPETQYDYTEEQIAQLRAAGYTGDEIDSYAEQMVPCEDLIRQANAARDAYIQDAIAPLYDTASDAYKEFISQTWLGLRERTDIDTWNLTAMGYQERKNLDYEKVKVYGNQLFIKVYLDDNVHADWFYCSVTPDEWKKLGDYGNVIVNYTYVTQMVGDDPLTSYEDTENIFITDASIEFVE